MKNQSGPIANPMTYPKIMNIAKRIIIKNVDFNLFLDIWSWKEILFVMGEGGEEGF